MPFLPFPPDWPVFTPKDRMADWLDAYARLLDLDVWTNTTCSAARYDDATGSWSIDMLRDGATTTVRAAHLVFATGMSGYPHVPDLPGRADFGGVQLHSSRYTGGAAFAAKRDRFQYVGT
jgi:putative flavoprotein involved in K+ transport